MNNQFSGRFQYLDYMKAICIILVVAGHCLNYYNKYFYSFNAIGQLLLALIYAVHVPTFFLISGFFIHKQGVVSFYKKKLFRIVIPYLFFSLLKVMYNNFISSAFLHSDGGVFRQVIDIFTSGEMYWFAYTIIIYYLISPILWRIKLSILKIVFIVTFLLNSIISILGISLPSAFQIQRTLFYFPFFLLGYLIRCNLYMGRNYRIKKSALLFLCFMTIILSILIRKFTYIYSIGNYFPIAFVLALSLMYPLLLLCKRLPVDSFVLLKVSTYSYQILLLDAFYKAILFLVFDSIMTIYVVLVIILLDISFCVLSCEIVKRLPIINAFFGLEKVQP